MNKKFSVTLTIIFCALLVQFQSAHGQDAPPPDTTWDADPLDVLEPKKQETVEPTVPEFKEIPESGAPAAAAPAPAAPKADVPPPEIPAAPAEQPPQAPADVASPAPAPAPAAPAPQVETPAPMMSSSGGSDADLAKEAKFHDIYKRFNEQPTSEEAWEKAAGNRKSEVYTVQKGNTLWDISNTFFGDPNFWPKIWSLNNDSILNPHEINPDMNIKFFPGTMTEAPTVAMAPAEGAADQVVPNGATETPAAAAGGEASAPEPTAPRKKAIVPVLKSLPSSLPSGKIGVDTQTPANVEVQVQNFKFPVGLEALSYYLTDAPLVGVGTVTGTEMDTKTAGDYQHIFVQLAQGAEKNYVVEKNFAEVPDPTVKNRKAQMVEVQGSIEILEKVNAQKNIYRALVKRAIMPVEIGSVLVPGNIPMIDPSPTATSNAAGAKIMGGQMGKNRGMFSSNSLLFLDAGTNRGLQEGQSLTVYADEGLRNHQTDAVMNDRQIGTVKIVKVTPNFATAYVTKSSDDILLGDYVGTATAKQAAATAAPVESHAPESKEQIDHELDLQGAPSNEPPPSSGSEDLDLEL